MSRAGFRKRRYYFTDNSIAKDTIVSFCLGGVALTTEITGVIFSIATKGHTPEIFATLYIAAFILALMGLFFAKLGKKAQEGGVKGKRFSVFISAVALIFPIIIFISGH